MEKKRKKQKKAVLFLNGLIKIKLIVYLAITMGIVKVVPFTFAITK